MGSRNSLGYVARLAVSAAALASIASVGAEARDIKVCLLAGKTGPFEAYAKQTEAGFMMGLEYLTKGSMTVGADKIQVIVKDDQLKPDRGKSLLEECYGDDKADIAVGTSGSPVALAMLPVAEERKKVLIVEPAVADSITGDKWNRYIFRTGRSSYQDALAAAAAIPADERRRHRHARPRHRLWPRWRQSLQGRACCDPPQGQDRRRRIRRRQHGRLRAVRRAPFQRSQGQARQAHHRLHLGRRASDGEVRRHEAGALQHHARTGWQHSSRS